MLHRPSKGDGIFLRQMKGHIRSLPVECMGYCRDNQVTRLLCKAQGEKKADGQMLVAMGREGQTGISYRAITAFCCQDWPSSSKVSRQKPKYSMGREWRCLESAGVSFGDAIGCPGKGLGLEWG